MLQKFFIFSLLSTCIMFSNLCSGTTTASPSYTPNFSINDVLYPEIKSFEEGQLKVSDIHTLWYAQYGNPKGTPVIVLHGGPGFGCGPNDMRYFDPEFYRIILFDQRGSKRSLPLGEIKNNTTQHLIQDVEKLKKHLKIDKWLVFGGSWGSAYALLYGEHYPESCLGFILRGIFLATESEYKQVWYGMKDIFPEVWEEFVNYLPESEQKDLIASYTKRINDPDPNIHVPTAQAFMKYDLTCAFLNVEPRLLNNYLNDHQNSVAITRIFTHYCNNQFFITNNEIINNIHKISHLPLTIIQGRYDLICRAQEAYKLKKAWPNSELIFIPESGHSALEIGTTKALVDTSNKFRDFLQKGKNIIS